MANFLSSKLSVRFLSSFLLFGLVMACGQNKAPLKPVGTPSASEQDGKVPESQPSKENSIGFDPIVGPEIKPELKPELDGEKKLPEFAPEVQQAIDAALDGPEWKHAEVFGHIWNIKPLTVTSHEGKTTVAGRISHHLPWALDNQIAYRFVFANGEVLELQIQIHEGGWLPFSGPILKIIEQFSGVVLPSEFLNEIYRQLSDHITGDWREQSQRLAAIIALEAYRQSESSQISH